MTQRARRRHRNGKKHSRLRLAVLAVITVVMLAITAAGSWVYGVADDAPSIDQLRPIDQGQNSVVFAADGSRLGYIQSDEARTPVSIDRIPKDLQFATVAIEDERFFEHEGVDWEGVLRAAVENIDAGEVKQGGSTITMQLMRNLYIAEPERDLKRKIIEAQLAREYEDRHGKEYILGQYLNTASYGTVDGRTAIGVQAASKTYFSKPVWKLTLEQSALLAGLPQAPSEYNPLLNPAGARERRNEVLQRMAKLGYISTERAIEGYQRGLQLDPSDIYTRIREPYFFDYVEQKLIDTYGVNTVRQGGLKVYTTLDPGLQEAGKAAIDGQLPYPTDPSAAVVAIDPNNGYIKAMSSSSNYEHNQYNLAAQGRRQPGSAFKTFVLATAIEQGIDPDTTYYTSKHLELDLPGVGHWSVSTADEGYLGTVNVTSATVASDNTVFAQLDLDVGPEAVAETARKMGITTELNGYPAEGLGGLEIGVSPLEMANAYATLAAGGVRHDPIAITKVVFPTDRVDHPEHEDETRVLSDAEAYEVTRILNMNITGGTGTAAYTGCSGQAGKTGTTDSFKDAWFTGYQPNLATAVWVGYPDAGIPMESVQGITVYGGTFPAQIWHDFHVNAAVPCESFPPPTSSLSLSSFTGNYTASRSYVDSYPEIVDDDSDKGNKRSRDRDAYDPDLYAPGIQDPSGQGGNQQPGAGPQQPPSSPPSSSPPSATGGVGSG
jgi:penicillin-binding protein 1A